MVSTIRTPKLPLTGISPNSVSIFAITYAEVTSSNTEPDSVTDQAVLGPKPGVGLLITPGLAVPQDCTGCGMPDGNHALSALSKSMDK